ncbi:hypothetical protein MA16_Dca023227 [Dendrobium catenatum]|uniref:Uncharacterized protein n=1 Tax=Dendrobium catenatum TaxID=906689 RepID=A0A2I0VW95_9ASPA|nr:hypothetical protein MA16_Dca023227 [Dendrobium catenatum]
MDHRSTTLALGFLALSLLSHSLSSPIHSPIPASSPSHPPLNYRMSEPAGLVVHSPPFPRSHKKHSPKPMSRHRHRPPPPPPPPPPPGKLNLGKRLGFAFAAIAAVLQLTFAAFLIYKRWQLKKMGRNYRMRVSS